MSDFVVSPESARSTAKQLIELAKLLDKFAATHGISYSQMSLLLVQTGMRQSPAMFELHYKSKQQVADELNPYLLERLEAMLLQPDAEEPEVNSKGGKA